MDRVGGYGVGGCGGEGYPDCAESVLNGFLFEVEEARVGDAFQGGITEIFYEGSEIKDQGRAGGLGGC